MLRQIIAKFDSYCYESNILIKKGEICLYHTKIRKVFHPFSNFVSENGYHYTKEMLI